MDPAESGPIVIRERVTPVEVVQQVERLQAELDLLLVTVSETSLDIARSIAQKPGPSTLLSMSPSVPSAGNTKAAGIQVVVQRLVAIRVVETWLTRCALMPVAAMS